MQMAHEAHGDGVAAAAGGTHRGYDAYVHQRLEFADVEPVIPPW